MRRVETNCPLGGPRSGPARRAGRSQEDPADPLDPEACMWPVPGRRENARCPVRCMRGLERTAGCVSRLAACSRGPRLGSPRALGRFSHGLNVPSRGKPASHTPDTTLGMEHVSSASIRSPATCTRARLPCRVAPAATRRAVTMRSGYAPMTARVLTLKHTMAAIPTVAATSRRAAGALNDMPRTSSQEGATLKTRALAMPRASLTLTHARATNYTRPDTMPTRADALREVLLATNPGGATLTSATCSSEEKQPTSKTGIRHHDAPV
jgi:hypothetical protein